MTFRDAYECRAHSLASASTYPPHVSFSHGPDLQTIQKMPHMIKYYQIDQYMPYRVPAMFHIFGVFVQVTPPQNI